MSAELLTRRRTPRPSARRRQAGVRDLRLGAPLPIALLIAIAAGILLAAAYPSANIWILAFPGVAGLLYSLRGRTFWSGVLVGFIGGMAYYLSLISWVSLFLGPVPLFALAGLMAIYMGFGGGLIALGYRCLPLLWTGRWGRIGVTPVVVAATWTAREAVANTFPYGGFAWGRVSLSQSTSPFAPLVAWLGLSGLTFVLVWLTAFALACALEQPALDVGRGIGRSPEQRSDARWAAILPRLLAVAIAFGAVLAVPPITPQETGTFRVAGIQANTNSGYFQHVDYLGQILDKNVQATLPMVGRSPQLIVWPEGASDLSPLASSVAAADWTQVTEITGSPLLGGAITERDGKVYNSSLLWEQTNGLTAIYDKAHPVPFGEYVPDRAFWTPFAPELLKLIGRDYTIGTRPSVMRIGTVKIGVDICFDIADDGLILGSVADGADILIAQTNNADFGTTDESVQQLAIARMRAIETGRSMVTVSTVASTTIIAPDGKTLDSVAPHTRGSVIDNVPLATGTTPAVSFGVALGVAIALYGALVPLIARSLLGRTLQRRRRTKA